MEAAAISSPPPNADSATRKLEENVFVILQELQSLRCSHEALQFKYLAAKENLVTVQKQRDAAMEQNSNLEMAVCETTLELDLLRELIRELEAFCREKQSEIERLMSDEISRRRELETELETCRGTIEKLEFNIKQSEGKNEVLSKSLVSLLPAKNHLLKIIRCHDNDLKAAESQLENEPEEIGDAEDELKRALRELSVMARLASEAESITNEFKERTKKEKKMLEDSIVSLTEENRDLNTFLRVALMEKEAVERNLNKLKGNTEHKKAALFQIAERGLQRVGFGFIIGSSSEQTAEEESGPAANRRSDRGDGDEEESVSLASIVERVMKNLRLEITELRRSLEDSRSDCEQLQSLVERQAQSIAENAVYIQELEDKGRVSAQNVEKLMVEIREAEAEAGRWMEACELEVEAGKKEVAERDKVIEIMRQELEKTRAALQISNGKLKMKEELVAAAMAAQAAAEQSLQLADSRANQFRSRMEELSRQLEAAEGRDRVRRKARHRCWPWSGLRDGSDNNSKPRRLPEMQPLLP